MIHVRLDYCNSVLYGTSSVNLNKLWTKRSEHITLIMAGLHWLPVKYQTEFKIAVITYKVLTSKEPSYLVEDQTNLVMANRAFSQSAPAVWNSLPQNIISDLSNLATFKQLEMSANAQRDGRPAELLNAAVWLTPTTRVQCNNAAKTRNPLKLPGGAPN